jgi:hypothetical protein
MKKDSRTVLGSIGISVSVRLRQIDVYVERSRSNFDPTSWLSENSLSLPDERCPNQCTKRASSARLLTGRSRKSRVTKVKVNCAVNTRAMDGARHLDLAKPLVQGTSFGEPDNVHAQSAGNRFSAGHLYQKRCGI